MYYNSDNPEEKAKKEKLLKALRDVYIQKEVESKNFDIPYSLITRMSIDENLIDTLFNGFINSFEFGNKIIHQNREKGIIAILNTNSFNSNYDSLKYQNVDFNNLLISMYQYQTDFIQTKYLLDLINTELNDINKKALDNFAKGLVRQKNKSQYIIDAVNDLLEAYIKFFQTSKNVSNQDRKYYELILEKVNQILRDFIIKYFEILPTKNINKIKKHFPNLISFLSTKNNLKSFKAVEYKMEARINLLRLRLINANLIDDIKEDSFKAVFSDKVIVNHINWIGEIGQLYYFINQIIKVGFIHKPKYKYMIASQCFKVNHNDLYADKLQHQHNPSNSKMNDIDKLLSF